MPGEDRAFEQLAGGALDTGDRDRLTIVGFEPYRDPADGCSIVMSVGSAIGPVMAAAMVPGVVQAVATATAPVTARARWQSWGMK